VGYVLNFTLIWRNFGRLEWGLLLSLELAVLAISIGSALGLALALIHTSGNRPMRMLVAAYVECIRNVPLLLLVYLVFYGVPTIVDIRYDAVTSFVVTLSLYAAAYLVEVFRAGLLAVPRQVLRDVRLPLMFRIVLPSLSNTFVSLFKDTSVASVIAVPELTYGAQWINFNTFRIIEVYMVVTPMYVVSGYAILWLLRRFERRFVVR
jgi:polar amino acid transport system permease protein